MEGKAVGATKKCKRAREKQAQASHEQHQMDLQHTRLRHRPVLVLSAKNERPDAQLLSAQWLAGGRGWLR